MSNGGANHHPVHESVAASITPLENQLHLTDDSGQISRNPPIGRATHRMTVGRTRSVRSGYLELTITPLTPSFARSYVSRVLAAWRLEKLTDTVQLITSELVTNAIKASGLELHDEIGPDGTSASARSLPWVDGTIWIGLYQSRYDVVVEVWDPCHEPPCLVTPDLDDPGGRGLWLVNELARRWGYRRPVTGGKWVWASIAVE